MLALLMALVARQADPLPVRRPGIPLDAAAVSAWADSIVKPAMAGSGIPGALVVVVRRDGIVLNRGYGLADVANRTPLDPERTLLQTASIGKSMTGMITAQLIHEGVLDLDRDVNEYLTSARIHGPKVTLRHLLTHRAGFDDDITGLFVPFDGEIRIPKAELDRRLRPLVPPGYATAYDNQGFGVIGLILRDVTGKPIPDLFRERLFEPAGMATAVHGRPADGMARLARCYTVTGPGAVRECESWLYRDGLMGAGGVKATGADMARYMRLLLDGGTLDGRVVIGPEGFADVVDFDHARFHPGMPGGGYAFIQFEEFRGLEYAHSGSMPGFSSMMKIYPDADVAILVVFLGGQVGSFDMTVTGLFNGLRQVSMADSARPGMKTMRELTDRFAERFIPADRPRSSESARMSAPADSPVEPYLGSYVIATNHSRSLLGRLPGWGGVIEVLRSSDSTVRFGGSFAAAGDYRRVGPLLYENAKGDRLAFATQPVGRYMAIGLSGGVFKQTNALESPGWSLPLFLFSLLGLLTALLQLRPGAPARLRRLAGRSLLGLVLVIFGVLAEVQWGVTQAVVKGAVVGPFLWRLAFHAGAAILVWEAIRFVRGREPVGRFGYGHGAVIGAAGVGLAMVLVAWRLIGAFPPWLWW